MGEIADMGPRALDDLAIGIDQCIGLAGQRRYLDREFAFEPLGAAGSDRSDRIRHALEWCQAEPDLKDRCQNEPDRQRQKRAREVIIERPRLLDDLGCVAGHRDHERTVAAEIDRSLDHPKVLVFRPFGIADAGACGRKIDALLFQTRQLLVPQRARGFDVRLFGVDARDLPIPAGQRQFE